VAAQPTPPLSRGAAWALALVATLTMAVSYVDRQTLAVLAPRVTAELGISEQAYGWLVSAFSIAYLVGAPLAGRLIDVVGARRGLLGAVVLWSAVAALHAVVPGFGVLFALRILLGLAESPSFPGAAQTVHRALPPHERARGLGVLFTGSSVGAMIAPLLATWVERHHGWRVAFLVTAAAGMLWVPAWLAVAYSRAGRAALDAPSAAASPPAPHRTSPPSARPSSAGVWLSVLRNPAVLRAMAVVFAASPGIALFLNWGSKYLVRTHELTQSDVGRYLWLPPLVFDVGAIAFGHYASKRARVRYGVPDRLLVSMAMVLATLMALVPFAPGPWSAVAIAGVALAGGGGLFALLTADMLMRVEPAVVSTAGGITAAAQSLAYIVVNPLIGMSVQSSGSYLPSMIGVSLWVVPGCLVWLAWKPPPPYSAPPAQSTTTS
jgi:ACS family hexuronate transporter-like MFS transporter